MIWRAGFQRRSVEEAVVILQAELPALGDPGGLEAFVRDTLRGPQLP